MLIKIMAAIFAAYECYKLLHIGAFSELIENLKLVGKTEERSLIEGNSFYKRVLFVEVCYLIFALVLLFTAYWYFTVVLLAISLSLFAIDTRTIAGKVILGMGSAVCVSLLMYIVLA